MNLEPNSFYGQTKLMNEKISDLYAQAYGMSLVGLRFFTVYGAFGRPDMAYFAFANALVNKVPITLFNNGNNFRDMTHISDIICGIEESIEYVKKIESKNEIFNLGNDKPIKTLELLDSLAQISNKKPIIVNKTSHNETLKTHADLTKSRKLLKYEPKIDFEDGIKDFFEWFLSYNS